MEWTTVKTKSRPSGSSDSRPPAPVSGGVVNIPPSLKVRPSFIATVQVAVEVDYLLHFPIPSKH